MQTVDLITIDRFAGEHPVMHFDSLSLKCFRLNTGLAALLKYFAHETPNILVRFSGACSERLRSISTLSLVYRLLA